VRRTLIVTATPTRRRLWEERLRDSAVVVRHCAGPHGECPIVLGRTCPLIDECDVVLYDSEVVTPDFLVALLASPPRAAIHFITSDRDGPRTTHVLSGGVVHPAAAAAGGAP